MVSPEEWSTYSYQNADNITAIPVKGGRSSKAPSQPETRGPSLWTCPAKAKDAPQWLWHQLLLFVIYGWYLFKYNLWAETCQGYLYNFYLHFRQKHCMPGRQRMVTKICCPLEQKIRWRADWQWGEVYRKYREVFGCNVYNFLLEKI